MQRSTDAKTLVETAYRRIKQLMLQQKIATGQKLLYRELIDWLQMSKTPIINALNRLEQDGFIVSEANRGFFVKPMTTREIADAFDVREALETKAVELAIARGTPADIERLARSAETYAAYENYKYDKKKLTLNAEFHLHMASLSGNEVLTYLLRRNMEHVILRLRLDNFPPRCMAISARDHQQLVAHVRQGDMARAKALVRRHVGRARDHVIKSISQGEVESPESLAFFEN